jgi:hypothetical protein
METKTTAMAAPITSMIANWMIKSMVELTI